MRGALAVGGGPRVEGFPAWCRGGLDRSRWAGAGDFRVARHWIFNTEVREGTKDTECRGRGYLRHERVPWRGATRTAIRRTRQGRDPSPRDRSALPGQFRADRSVTRPSCPSCPHVPSCLRIPSRLPEPFRFDRAGSIRATFGWEDIDFQHEGTRGHEGHEGSRPSTSASEACPVLGAAPRRRSGASARTATDRRRIDLRCLDAPGPGPITTGSICGPRPPRAGLVMQAPSVALWDLPFLRVEKRPDDHPNHAGPITPSRPPNRQGPCPTPSEFASPLPDQP